MHIIEESYLQTFSHSLYLAEFDARKMRRAITDLFKILDTKLEDRDPYLKDDFPELAAFPYVNGGLFANEDQNSKPKE